jgi:hypothetical protein
MRRRLISIVLAAAMVLSMVPAVAAANAGLTNFNRKRTYIQGQFTDVLDSSWYAYSVKAAYEFALMEGNGGGQFAPDAFLKLSESLALACRLRDIYNGGDGNFKEGSPWYQVYVDYAIGNGMIYAGTYSDYNVCATRAQFAEIMAKAFPEEALPAINNIAMGSLPDVPETASYAQAVYKLYNAGILAGNDDYGTFNPAGYIRRSEVATMMIRMASADSRERLNLKVDVTGIALDATTASLETGKALTLTATVSPDKATDKTVTWNSSNTAVATVSGSGTVTGVSAGTAVITAKAGSFAAACTVTVTEAPIIYSGTGDKVITGVDLPAGSYYAEYTHNGKRNFISKLYYIGNSYSYFLLSNEIGKCSGQAALYENGNAKITNGILEVQADGDWTITFRPVSGTTTTNIKGSGQTVTGIFTATTDRNILTCTHDGSNNFIVMVIPYNGPNPYDYESVTNEIGNYSGQKLITLTVGEKYYIYVRADGDWTINFGLGDPVTTYTQPTISGRGTGGSLEGSESVYSYSEASKLSSYASSATEKADEALNYLAKALIAKNTAQQLTYLNYAVFYADSAVSYEQKAADILTAHATITDSDGAAVLKKAKNAIDQLNAVASLALTEDNMDAYISDITTNLMQASTDCLSVQEAAVALLKAITS